jgi:hypothetical protein
MKRTAGLILLLLNGCAGEVGTSGGDASRPGDMRVANDSASPGDMAAPSDLAVPADLTMLPDLLPPPPPDLSGPPAGFDINTMQILNSPSDVASWPETAKITKLDFGNGIFVDFTKRASMCNPDGPAGVWPSNPSNGPGADLEYTIWLIEQINGTWYASGGIEYWCDDHYVLRNGGYPSGFGMNWFYDPNRWGPMANRQPAVGEVVGFMLTQGDARNDGLSILHERSNVVFVPFPDDNGIVYNY